MSVKVQPTKIIQPYWSTRGYAAGVQQGDQSYFQDVLGQTVAGLQLNYVDTNIELNGQFPKGRSVLVYGLSQYFHQAVAGVDIDPDDKNLFLDASFIEVKVDNITQSRLLTNMIPESLVVERFTTNGATDYSNTKSTKNFFMFNNPIAIPSQSKFSVVLSIPVQITLTAAVRHKFVMWTREAVS